MTPGHQQRQLTERLRDCACAAQVRDEIIKVQKTPGVEPPLHARSLARIQRMTLALEGGQPPIADVLRSLLTSALRWTGRLRLV
jgi:hypothetical protein